MTKIKVLFLCWGYSIHAERHIKIFCDDPAFSVAVASTHDYQFKNAENVLLDGKTSGNTSQLFSLLTTALSLVRTFWPILLAPWTWPKLRPELVDAVYDMQTVHQVVRTFKPDVIFLQTMLYPCYLALTLPRSIPQIITFWNGDLTWWAKYSGLEQMLKKKIVTTGCHRASAITVNSQTAFDTCLTYGVRKEMVHIIRYPGVDLKLFKPIPKTEARIKLKITHHKVILWPRGLGGYLNSEVFLDALCTFWRTYPDTLVLFTSQVGMKEHGEQYQRAIKEKGYAQNVRFEAQVPFEHMPLYYAAADVMVSLSSNDSMPNVMLEAMACGTPVIMSDIPQIREWVNHGQNGYLVPPTDAHLVADTLLTVFKNIDNDVYSNQNKNIERIRSIAEQSKVSTEIKELVLSTYQHTLKGERHCFG